MRYHTSHFCGLNLIANQYSEQALMLDANIKLTTGIINGKTDSQKTGKNCSKGFSLG